MMGTFTRLTSAPVELVLSKLSGAKQTRSGWQARCPAHDDRQASLSISQGDDGRCLIKCHANCEVAAVVARMGLEMGDLFTPKTPQASSRRAIDATYDYTDAAGVLLYQAVRYRPKGFSQRRPDGPDRWIWNLDGVTHVLYRLPEVERAIAAGQRVYVVEGEKDVETLRLHGLVATCNAMGACKWEQAYTEVLQGAEVVILPDNDKPGHDHAALVGASLQGSARSIKRIDLDGLPDHGDVSDWLDQGHTIDELQRLVDAAPIYEPSTAPTITEPSPTRRWLTEEEHDQLPPGDYLLDQEIPADGITVLYGPSGSGKTFVALDYTLKIAQIGPVMVVPAEDSAGWALRRRAWRGFHQNTNGTVYTWPEEVNLMNPAGDVDTFIDQVRDLGLRFVVFDTLHQSMVGADENSSRDMGIVIQSCKRIQRETGAAVMLVHHTGKNGSSERGSSALRGAAHTMIELSNEDGLIRLRCEKAKNAAPFADRSLRLFETGGSCVALPAESVLTTKAAPLSKAQRDVLEMLDLETFETTGAKSAKIATSTLIPEGSLWRTLSTLKRHGYVRQGAKGDPFYITEAGKAKLREGTFTRNPEQQEAQPSLPSLTIISPSDGDPSTHTTNHQSPSHPLGVMVDGGSDGGSTTKVLGPIEFDQRRMAELDRALADGDTRAARKAADGMRGRKTQAEAESKINDYESALQGEAAPT